MQRERRLGAWCTALAGWLALAALAAAAPLTVTLEQATPGAAPGQAAMIVVRAVPADGAVREVLRQAATVPGEATLELPAETAPLVVQVEAGGAQFPAEPLPVVAGQPLRIPVYETTPTAAPRVTQHHVFIHAAQGQFQVREMVVVTQPEPRAWIGEPGAEGRRETVAFALPAGAREVQFRRGADACCTVVREGRVAVTQPLLPGETTYDFHYQLPATGATTRWSTALLYPTARMLLMAPTDSVALASDDLPLTQETMADGKTLAVAELTDQPAGRALALRLSLTASGAPPPVSHRVVLSTWWWSALGGLVLVLYCLWQWWRSRPTPTPEPAPDDLLAFLVSQIAELDHAYLTNQVSRQYYGTARDNLKRQLAARLVTPDHDHTSPQHPSPA